MVGALGTISKKLPSYLKKLHIKDENLEKSNKKTAKSSRLGLGEDYENFYEDVTLILEL